MTDFEGLGLNQPILRALKEIDYTQPTPIQEQTIPALLEGRDILGIAQTGTGKTASFALPMLNRLTKNPARATRGCPRGLILAPTRELAVQISDNIRTYAKYLHLRTLIVCGGMSIRPQIMQMNKGVHILVATPGRLLDLMNQGHVSLSEVEFFVLDEGDRMLDMGFQRDLQKITAKLPAARQTALFSATMPKTVSHLANGLLNDPVKVEVMQQATTAEKVSQQVLFVAKDLKRNLLIDLMGDSGFKRVLVFTRTKHGADRVSKHLQQSGITSDAIHGNKAQNARQRALASFKTGAIRVLVATDIAARGIDVDGVTHVINFDLPNEPDSYVHRIGRTARNGASGSALSFCDPSERVYLKDIEKTIRQPVPVNEDHAYHRTGSANNAPRPNNGGQRNGQNNGKPGGDNAGKPGGQRRRSRRSGFQSKTAA
tara:strand:- start:155057 stop:156343 length:1287 start_codon:yes stop_codon:yes gene_type:complete